MLEWKKLGEVCSFNRGKTITAKDACDGDVPVIAGGQTPSYFHNESNRIGESITVAGSGAYAGFVSYWNQPIFVSDAFTVDPKGPMLHKYLFHWLKMNQQRIFATQKGAGVPHVHGKDIANFEIPVPSIAEQTRIVGILDTFTASIENLKQQIAQRRKQYEHYRTCFFSNDEWEHILVGKLTKIFSCPRVFKDQWQDSGVPFWRSSDIMSYHNGVKNPRGEVFISQSLYEELSFKSEKIKEGDILVTGGGSIGMPYLKTDDSPLFVKDADLICIQKCSSIVPKYLYHYFLSTDFKLYLKKITHDATIAHYTINQIKDTPIPVPSLPEQQRIVSILDTFEASIANLEQQLAQRERQYEYYRNKLLTFE